MSRFEKLRELHVKQDKVIDEYWQRLNHAAGQLLRQFEEYLELPARTYEIPGQSPTRYVQIGIWDGAKFEETHILSLERSHEGLRFGIRVTVDKAANQHPKEAIVIPISIGTQHELKGPLVVKINPGTEKERAFVTVGDEFDDVVEEIYKQLESCFSRWL